MPKRDPKQIVTPYALEVAPELLGLPLATPRRRFAALLIDLAIAGILSLFGALLLATAVSILFFLIALRRKYEQWYKNFLKYVYATGGSALMFVLAVALIEATTASEPYNVNVSGVPTGTQARAAVDWSAFGEKAMNIDYSNSENAGEQWQQWADELEKEIMASTGQIPEGELQPDPLPENAPEILRAFAAALQEGDSVRIDSLEPLAANIAARNKLAELQYLRGEDQETILALTKKNEELAEIVENPGIYRLIKQLGEDAGLAVGWIGLYFVIGLAWWGGQTPGKKLMKLRVTRLNGTPLNLWYSFERLGGYAAGLATGLLGFFQVYWDPNRQGIHDKIAGTVVLDLRESQKEKTETYRAEMLDRENLLS